MLVICVFHYHTSSTVHCVSLVHVTTRFAFVTKNTGEKCVTALEGYIFLQRRISQNIYCIVFLTYCNKDLRCRELVRDFRYSLYTEKRDLGGVRSWDL
jgi:hypothetical protein